MKLMTKELRAKLPKLYSQEKLGEDAVVHIKFFCPWNSWNWFATEGQERGGDFIFFGLVCGFETELGYFSLSELESVRGFGGLGIERDLHFKPKTIREVRQEHARMSGKAQKCSE